MNRDERREIARRQLARARVRLEKAIYERERVLMRPQQLQLNVGTPEARTLVEQRVRDLEAEVKWREAVLEELRPW